MNNSLPRLLVIDDNTSFLNEIQVKLKNQFQVSIYYSKEGIELQHILEYIRNADPEYCLLDVNLHTAGIGQTILQRATETQALKSTCKIWMISQADENEDRTLKQFQALNNNVQNTLLRKPITPFRLSGELLDETVFEAQETLWTELPLPIRVLTSKGKIAYANQQWINANYPDPAHKVLLWNEQNKAPEHKNYSGSFGKETAGFTLHCFEVEQNDQLFLAQVAERHPIQVIPNNLDATVEDIFATMQRAGFSRGRFYRIETLAEHRKSTEYKQAIELQRLSYSVPEQLKLPYRFPLQGVLRTRLKEYTTNVEHKPDELWSEIHNLSNEQDSHLQDLNTKFGLQSLESWLEVPVWIIDPEQEQQQTATSNKAESCILAAVLVFDRIVDVPDQANSDGIIDDQVTDDNVRPIQSLLMSLLLLLKRAFQQEYYQRLHSYEKTMRSFDQELVKLTKPEQQYQKILEILCQLSGARSGIMVINQHPDRVDIVATAGTSLPTAIRDKKMVFSLDATDHPIVAAWTSGKQLVYQDYSDHSAKDALQNKLKSDHTYKQPITSDEQAELIEWLDTIHSLLATPIQTAAQQTTIGGITLQFNQPGLITQNVVQQINAVLHRARWVIQQACYERAERFDYWQQVLGHDMKTSLNIVDGNLQRLEKRQENLKPIRQWIKIKRYLQDATDQAENWMDMMSDRLERRGESFTATALNEFLELSQLRLEDDKINLKFSPEQNDPIWDSQLFGNEMIFGRILRVLLDNAFKFGRHAVDDEKTPITIDLQAKQTKLRGETPHWVLAIKNPGAMSQQAEQLCFIAGKIPDDRQTAGAHVGLAIAKRWTETMGGSLTLTNEAKNQLVIAELTWPMAGQTKQETII